MTKKINNINTAISKDKTFYILFLFLVLLPQYFRGGYFESAYLPFTLGISIFMIYHIWNRYKGNRTYLINDEADLLLLGFVLIYALTFFYGINKRESIIEFIKNASYLSIFFIARDLHKDNRIRNKTINIVILSGILLSIIGVGTMIGTWEYSASYNGSRLSSTFQYPNTLAAYVSAMYFLTMGQAMVNKDPKKIGLYGGGLFVFFSTLIFTYSRGMWVLFPVFLLGFFIILSSNKKVELFFNSLGSFIIATPVSFLFMKYVGTGSSAQLWGLYIIGILLSSLILFILGKATESLNKISWKTVIAIVLVIAIGAIGLLGMAIRATEPLIYENQGDEIVFNHLMRTIKDVFPNTEYDLNIKGTANVGEEGTSAGSIIIYSVNEQIQYTSLGIYNIEENGEFDLNLPITTLEDTNTIVVQFINENPKTRIVFSKLTIKDVMMDEIAQIPLKYKYIPESIVTRISGIGTTDDSFQARVIFSKDALKLVKDRFLVGIGGGGWATAYRSIQSYPYWSNQVHNHYLQQFVEVGLIGSILFMGFLFSLMYRYFLYRKKEEDINNRTLVDTLVISIGVVLGHAMMDFDLSYVGLMTILWVLLGIFHSIVRIPKDELKIFKIDLSKKHLKTISTLVSILTIITLGISSSLYAASFIADKATEHQDSGDIDKMEKSMKGAVTLDPYNRRYRTDLMNVYFYQYEAKSDGSYGYEAKAQVDRLLKQEKHNPLVYIEVAQAYFKFGLIEEALDLLYKSLEMQPLITESYVQSVDGYLSVVDYYINANNLEKAKAIAEEGVNKIENLLLTSNKRSMRPMASNDKLYTRLSKLKYYSRQIEEFASYLDNGYDMTCFYDFGLDVDNDEKIELVTIWNDENGELSYEIKDEGIRLSNSGTSYGVLDIFGFELTPETEYKVVLDAKGDMAPDKVSFYILDTNAAEQLQIPSTPIELKNEWNTYEIEFTTDNDIGENTSIYRFIIGGENQGKMDLKNIKLFEKLN